MDKKNNTESSTAPEDDKHSSNSTNHRKNRLYIVGIGASAGGLEALKEFLSHVEGNSRLSYVVAQHLSPSHSSMLKTLLSRESKLDIVDLTGTEVPKPGTVYITPPNKDVEIKDGVLRLDTPMMEIGPRPSINRFFQSLADDQGEHAIGVILSGTGGDGASGIMAIKTAGGTTLVQEPATAKYDGMPNSAIQTTSVDLILPPAKMGPTLTGFVEAGELIAPENETHDNGADTYDRIITIIRERTGFDLFHYKTSTLKRRIQRRMALHHFSNMEDYLQFIIDENEEAVNMAQDVLISVTEFFRDTKAFEALSEIITQLIEQSPIDHTIRIWVPGCATGEEAFTIAILFEEAMRRLKKVRSYLIFATDINSHASTSGRRGCYPAASFESMDSELVERYFEKHNGGMQASKKLRDRIVFSVHNLIQDPPFSRIDLVSCRNLLIYFTQPLQKRVMEIFHYALLPSGYLFLGKSETASQHEDLFATVNKEARLYKKIGRQRSFRLLGEYIDPSFNFGLPPAHRTEKLSKSSLEEQLEKALTHAYGPPSVVVSANDELLHSTHDASLYLHLKSGPAGLNIFDMAHEELRAELRALVYKCRRENTPTTGGRHSININGDEQYVRMAVRPLDVEAGKMLVISFENIPEPTTAVSDAHEQLIHDDPLVVELEHELTTTREHLQTVVEELETSNEELQSLNEELQSSNEELQSTNEELQTSNEELQSTNEELLTVNEEVQVKSHELEVLASDLQNLQENMDFPIIVVDNNLRITRYVSALDRIAPISEVQIGDSLMSLTWRAEIPDLRRIVAEVTDSGESYFETVTVLDRLYQLQVVPYRMRDNTISGALLIFPDTTALHSSNKQLEISQRRLSALIDNITDGLITIDTSDTILSFNRSAETIFGYSAQEMIGEKISVLMPPDYSDSHIKYIEQYVKTRNPRILGRQRIVQAQRKNGEIFPLEISVNEMIQDGKQIFTGLVRDVTERRRAEEALFQEKERAQVTLHSIADAVITTDVNGKVEYMNPVAERLTGCAGVDAISKPLNEVLKIVPDESAEAQDELTNPTLLKQKSAAQKHDVLLQDSSGAKYPIEFSAAPILNRAGNVSGAVFVFNDVSEKQGMLQQIAWHAKHDPLTGLVNRSEMERRLKNALQTAKTLKREHVLLYIDLDQFKVVNDTCGHNAGDELLRQIGGQIAGNLRHRDTLARLGGDEFGVLMENCTVTQGQHIAEKIVNIIQDFRFAWDNKIFKIGASIGVVTVDHESGSMEQLFADADTACYAAKENGRNRAQLHSHGDEDLALRRREMQWVTTINQAMDDDRFCLHLQQISSLSNKDEVYWEVLLRMIDDKGELIMPGVFLPAAERYNLMQSVDRWVLDNTLCAMQHCSQDKCLAQYHDFSVNLSGASLIDDKFLKFAREKFEQYNTETQRLCFEITETVAIANFTKARAFIKEMKKLGCRFALDDFGSGMSSFGYLKNLPVDYLKIDGSFVKNLNKDLVDLATVESINRIGHLMDMRTIAEFAEDDEILEKLRNIGVDYAQGFAVHRPVSMKIITGETLLPYPSDCD